MVTKRYYLAYAVILALIFFVAFTLINKPKLSINSLVIDTQDQEINWKNTFAHDAVEFSKKSPISINLADNHRVRIRIDNVKYYIGVTSISNSDATLEFSKDSQKISLAVGEKEKLNANDDNLYDIELSLEEIKQFPVTGGDISRALLLITPISEEFSSPPIEDTGVKLVFHETKIIKRETFEDSPIFIGAIATMFIISVIFAIENIKSSRLRKKSNKNKS